MRKKITILIIVVALIALAILICNNVSVETEYTPEPEIEDTEYRNTAISLYFQDKETKQLQIETRLIDSKELLKDPYLKLLTLLLEGPNNNNLESVIPNETKIISVTQEGETLVIDLSSEFLQLQNLEDNVGLDEKQDFQNSNAIYSIVNTVTELKEISLVKFLIDGKEMDGLEMPFAHIK